MPYSKESEKKDKDGKKGMKRTCNDCTVLVFTRGEEKMVYKCSKTSVSAKQNCPAKRLTFILHRILRKSYQNLYFQRPERWEIISFSSSETENTRRAMVSSIAVIAETHMSIECLTHGSDQ